MKGHTTNGGWDDVTSSGRNEIVFEGRHKEYGAYYIRQRYNFALLLGLLFSLSVGVIGAGVPFIIQLLTKKVVIATNTIYKDKKTIYYATPFKPVPPPHPAPKQPHTNATANTVPVVTQNQQQLDSEKTARDMHNVDVGARTEPGPPSPPSPPDPPGPPSPPAPPAPVMVADVMPKFPGDLGNFIVSHVNYPAYLRDAGIEGIVYVTFVVEMDGSVSNIKVLRGIAGGPQLSDETVAVVQQMPNWTPGSQKGHPVRVQYTLPVHFQLK